MLDDREHTDEVIGALVARLRAMSASDPRARAAILARVRGRRPAPWRAALAWAWQPSVPMLAAAGVVMAALVAGYAGRIAVEPPAGVIAQVNPAQAPVLAVSNDPNAERLAPVQFVLRATGANRVALVGDFNAWGAQPTLLSMHSGVWEVTVPLHPGRHTYAFLVNDSVWTIDPRAPSEVDRDFGRASSVILVSDR